MLEDIDNDDCKGPLEYVMLGGYLIKTSGFSKFSLALVLCEYASLNLFSSRIEYRSFQTLMIYNLKLFWQLKKSPAHCIITRFSSPGHF